MKVKNLMVGLIFALVLCFTPTIFGQGCSGDVWEYSSATGQTYIYKNIGGKLVLVQIDRANTSENRMAIRFKPQSVRVEQGKNIQFEVETDTGVTGAWYAIYHKATEDFSQPINANNYLLPLAPNELSGKSGQVNARRIPNSRYYLDDRLIETSPEIEIPTTPILSDYYELSNFQLNTEKLAPGFYWFTLQTNVVYNGQNPNQCPKTTPPVLIEIYRPINNAPTVNIFRIDEPNCDQRIITAKIRDEDNLPNSGNPPQDLSITWKINGQIVSNKLLGKNSEYTDYITTDKLENGNHNVEVYVTDGELSAFERRAFTIDCPPEPVDGKGAGIIYFQFAEPYESLPRKVFFNIGSYLRPEEWVDFYSNTRGTQCRKAYPDYEFTPFYDYWKKEFDFPVPAMTKNTNKLDEIIQELKKNENYNLDILGYADFRASYEYNVKLVDRRLDVVKRYLIDNGISANRLTFARVENNSNSKARSREKDNCADSRRHDRRVELVYYTGDKRPPLPNYARLYKNRENENGE